MSKTLLDRFLSSAVQQGRLGVVHADGSHVTYGTATEGYPEVVRVGAGDPSRFEAA